MNTTDRQNAKTYERYKVSVNEYTSFKKQGFLVVRNLVPKEDTDELRQHTEDLMQGRLPEQSGEVPVLESTSRWSVS